MTDSAVIALSTLAGLISGLITAYVTSSLKLKAEKEKWDREFALKYLEAKFSDATHAQEIASRYAIAFLAVVEITDDGFEGSPRKVFIPGGFRLVAGRSPTCDIVLNHPDISREHIMFKADDKDVWIQDLGTRAGTYVLDRHGSKKMIDGLQKLERATAISVPGYEIRYFQIGKNAREVTWF